GIVPIHDVGQLPDGRVFTVMMLVRGEALDVSAARLPLRDRLRLFDRVCDTVSFAHDRGIVHRDLKPANVMAGPVGRIFVLDWGLAGPGSDQGQTRVRPGSDWGQTGVRLGSDHLGSFGTHGYAAPEQSTQNRDPRVDVYALGAILRDLLDGCPAEDVRPLRSI